MGKNSPPPPKDMVWREGAEGGFCFAVGACLSSSSSSLRKTIPSRLSIQARDLPFRGVFICSYGISGAFFPPWYRAIGSRWESTASGEQEGGYVTLGACLFPFFF